MESETTSVASSPLRLSDASIHTWLDFCSSAPFADEIHALQVSRRPSGLAHLGWVVLDDLEPDTTHMFWSVVDVYSDVGSIELSYGDLVLLGQLSTVLARFHAWRAKDLRSVCVYHSVTHRARDTTSLLLGRLRSHECEPSCYRSCVVLKKLARPRRRPHMADGVAILDETGDSGPLGANDDGGTGHADSVPFYEVASAELRRMVIDEWQTRMHTDQLIMRTCAVCARRWKSSAIHLVPVEQLNLNLLVNDDLPLVVRPTTYNFEAYDGALLHPEGMTDLDSPADLVVCRECYLELVERERMPKYALANWLYYAWDELPGDVSRAFADATRCEKIITARARCSKISYKFTEIHRTDAEGGRESARGAATSQRCVRGNVLVMPQDATHLNTALPPVPDVVKDMVCAVFVGMSKPSRDTVAKLGPFLVSRSRVKCIIDFLVANNPHYGVDPEFSGFSEENLRLLFEGHDHDVDSAVPFCIDVGFLHDSAPLDSADSDYTGRRDEVDAAAGHGQVPVEAVGYTQTDGTPMTYLQMKMRALAHCLSGGKFVQSRAGNRFVTDFDNPSLLTWLFPHLDPWGIGGFCDRSRTRPLTMEDQLSYLLRVANSPFERDPDFAFVCYNIIQKKRVCDTVNFRVKVSQQESVVHRLLHVDQAVLTRMIAKCKRDPLYRTEDQAEKYVLSVMQSVSLVGRDIPGTAAYKVSQRNEIRSLIQFQGTPALFVTLNPSDIHNPLVRLYAGENIRLEDAETGASLSDWQRMVLVANYPCACAMAFHEFLSAFISVVLRFGRPGRGLFGKCTGYYGVVEAQGRGTLHCHMLIWLHGHPSPQDMRDSMLNCEQYQRDLFCWLESLIKCELLGATEVVTEPGGVPLRRPDRDQRANGLHPGLTPAPRLDTMTDTEFLDRYDAFVNELVEEYQWHEHKGTCWKYLRRGAVRDDSNCRMRIDGSTREVTAVDEETGSILLRRLHPRVANYNDLVIFLMKCNMDIKHIGSGPAAKALVYYVTDYVTKAPVAAHVGLAALLCAVQKAKLRVESVPLDERGGCMKGALTTAVNCMLARQETSHQQVMSYLVGGGDHYASHTYRAVHFAAFERLVRRHWEGDDMTAPVDRGIEPVSVRTSDTEARAPDELHGPDDTVHLSLGVGTISALSQLADYTYRPAGAPFLSMCLYEFVGTVERITLSREDARTRDRAVGACRGRRAQVRGRFLPQHPQHSTHLLRKRTTWVVPVLLGDRIARPDRSDTERENWARSVLTLFVPWRHPADLKESSETWYDAYSRRSQTIPPEHRAIVSNMNVLSECRDAREEHARHRGRGDQELPSDHAELEDDADPAPSYGVDELDAFEGFGDLALSPTGEYVDFAINTEMDARSKAALDRCFWNPRVRAGARDDNISLVRALTDSDSVRVAAETEVMKLLKKRRRPDVDDECTPATRRARFTVPPSVTASTLSEPGPSYARGDDSNAPADDDTLLGVIQQVVYEKSLTGNPEQLRAFRVIAHHVCFGTRQLLMYMGGMGGTGKTFVVNAVLRLFELLGRRKEVLVGAPTGAAAILTGGHTMHSLTHLPQSRTSDLHGLVSLWAGVTYLICDEVSMVGARFLSQVSKRLQQAKGDAGVLAEEPFGGVNVIFTGDFAQLSPVMQSSLYNHRLVSAPSISECQSADGVGALQGIYLWRLVDTVVMLARNQRQTADPAYGELLSRIRVGKGQRGRAGDRASDIDTVRSRLLSKLAVTDPLALCSFVDAPVIVGRRKLRDVLNARLLRHHAERLGETVHLYYATDTVDGSAVSERASRKLHTLPSSITRDSLGRLPLFVGMKVMIQENLAFANKVVNGAEGTVHEVRYNTLPDGRRRSIVVYVRIKGAGRISEDLEPDVVPIFPVNTAFKWNRRRQGRTVQRTVIRTQLPLLPAYSYTDYKSQGRTLDRAIVDLDTAKSLQSVYVMLSRVRTLSGLAILRPFSPEKLCLRLSQELQIELRRLDVLDCTTRRVYEASMNAARCGVDLDRVM